MKYIDTHSHLYADQFSSDRAEVNHRAKAVLSHVFLPNIDEGSIDPMLKLTDSDPEFFLPMMGLHPCSVGEDYKEVLERMEKHFSDRRYYGVGETGLDYYWDKTFVEQQKASLKIHFKWAKEMDLPVILHCRDSMDDVIEMVDEAQDGSLKGIFHCFTGDAEQAKRIMDLGFLMGIGGVLTFKNSGLDVVMKDVGLEHLVLETDSPYLAPVPFRGKRNESSYVSYIGEKLAGIKSVSATDVAKITSENALRIFGL